MKNSCKCELRTHMTNRLKHTRKNLHLSQEKFAEQLMISPRSYSDLERGDSFCCTLTFIIYLVYFCKDTDRFLRELKMILDKELGSK